MTGKSTVGRWLATKISAGVPSRTVVALWVAMNCGTLAAAQKNVLILTSEDTFRPVALVLVQNIRKALVDGSTNHLEFYTETLDQARFPVATTGRAGTGLWLTKVPMYCALLAPCHRPNWAQRTRPY
jgi:hypothetical protein